MSFDTKITAKKRLKGRVHRYPFTDKTLSIENAPADAKATGKIIEILKSLAESTFVTTEKNKMAIAVERSRIDNIARLSEGSTTGDAELQDLRVGADGKTYSSAGEAMRGQVSQLSESITETSDGVKEICNSKTKTFLLSDIDGSYFFLPFSMKQGNEYIIENIDGVSIAGVYGRYEKYKTPSLQTIKLDLSVGKAFRFIAEYDMEWIVLSGKISDGRFMRLKVTEASTISQTHADELKTHADELKTHADKLSQFVEISPLNLNPNDFIYGGCSSFGGASNGDTTRITYKDAKWSIADTFTIIPNDEVQLFVYCSDNSKTNWISRPFTFERGKEYTVIFAYKTNATITDIADLVSKYEIVNDFKNAVLEIKNTVETVKNLDFGKYKGKKISILGDSISTFSGYSYTGNRCRYPQNNLLTDVNDTYWMRLVNDLGMTLGINEAWAGSLVSNTQASDSGDKGPNRHIASQTRINHLGENGTPDIILVNGGTNDIGASVEIGTFDYENPMNYTAEQIANLPVATFADAYRTMLIRLQKKYPTSKILVLLPNYTTYYYTPQKADEYCEIIKEACDYFGVKWKDMRASGITIFNRATYLPDGIHYNANGMEVIEKNIKKFMLYDFTL